MGNEEESDVVMAALEETRAKLARDISDMQGVTEDLQERIARTKKGMAFKSDKLAAFDQAIADRKLAQAYRGAPQS